jgi:hypothetical protein
MSTEAAIHLSPEDDSPLAAFLWKYGLIFRTLCWAIGVTPASGGTLALASHSLVPNRLISNSLHSAAVRRRSRRRGSSVGV